MGRPARQGDENFWLSMPLIEYFLANFSKNITIVYILIIPNCALLCGDRLLSSGYRLFKNTDRFTRVS